MVDLYSEEVIDANDAEAEIAAVARNLGRDVPRDVLSDGLKTVYGPGPIPGTAVPKPGFNRNMRTVKQRFRNCPKRQ